MGRIGRDYLRYALDSDDIDVVAVKDIADSLTLARLLRHDSTFGPLRKQVDLDGSILIIDGNKIAVSASRDPSELDWRSHEVEVVIESTGKFRTRDGAAAHLRSGASKVLISAPGKDVDATIVMGVNDECYQPKTHHILSNASCTTNCVAPMVKVLQDAFGIEHGFMTTVHAYTNDQNVLDGPHKDARRARSAEVNTSSRPRPGRHALWVS
jgi:glyceraldehyde 3-phosphate dehydrogenase